MQPDWAGTGWGWGSPVSPNSRHLYALSHGLGTPAPVTQFCSRLVPSLTALPPGPQQASAGNDSWGHQDSSGQKPEDRPEEISHPGPPSHSETALLCAGSGPEGSRLPRAAPRKGPAHGDPSVAGHPGKAVFRRGRKGVVMPVDEKYK